MPVTPITGSPFQIETSAGSNGLVQLNLTPRDTFALSGAGLAAVVNQINTYLSSSKCTALLRLAPHGRGLEVHVTPAGCSYPVLTADVAAQVSALTTIVQTAANVVA